MTTASVPLEEELLTAQVALLDVRVQQLLLCCSMQPLSL